MTGRHICKYYQAQLALAMANKLRIVLVSSFFAVLFACQSKESSVGGCWHCVDEQKNFHAICLSEHNFYEFPDFYNDSINYEIEGDSMIIYPSYDSPFKVKFSVNDGILSFSDMGLNYSKSDHNDIISQYNAHKGLHLTLPEAENLRSFRWIAEDVIPFLISVGADKDSVFYSCDTISATGEFLQVYLAYLSNLKENQSYSFRRIYLAINSKISMKHVRQVHQKLNFYRLYHVYAICKPSNYIEVLGMSQSIYINDSIMLSALPDNHQPPPPPPPDLPPEFMSITDANEIVENGNLFLHDSQHWYVNGKRIEETELFHHIVSSQKSDSTFAIALFVPDSCNYQTFITAHDKIRTLRKKLIFSYVQKNYDHYGNLVFNRDSVYKHFRTSYPMYIRNLYPSEYHACIKELNQSNSY